MNKKEEISNFAIKLKNEMIQYATKELEKKEEDLKIRVAEGQKVQKLSAKIETLKNFIQLINNLSDSDTVRIIKVYSEVTDTRYKAVYDINLIKEIINKY